MKTRIGPAGWIALAAMALLLVLAIVFLVVGWGPGSEDGGRISFAGYVAMTLGVLFTFALGAGLMALIFYGNRRRGPD